MVTRREMLSTAAAGGTLAALGVATASPAQAAETITWKGFTWTVRQPGVAGPGPNQWSPNNVWVDANDHLHLRITNTGGVWECAELQTTGDLGFGTYQWQVEGRVDQFDQNVILGLFNYGLPDGNNEIDIEWGRFGDPNHGIGNFTVYPASGGTVGHTDFNVTLDGTFTTNRFTWTNNTIDFWVMGGHQPLDTTTNVIRSWTYAPDSPEVNIPQKAMPLHLNLWLAGGRVPTNGQTVEIIIHDFAKV